MASKIILKKSSVAAKAPVAADLEFGELALNYTDSKLYFKKADGTTIDAFSSSTAAGTVTSVGGTGSYGGLTLTGTVTTSGNLTLGGTPTGTWPISVSGSSASTSGNAATATALQTARTINGVSFNGTANITVADSTKQPLDADLTAIAALVGTSGLLRKTAADTWSLDTNAYVTSSGVTSVSGTAPIVSSGGATPAISITAATTSAAGSMSAADKTKLDGIATGATANTGTVTSVGGTGTVSGLTLSGTVTTSGNLTLGGTLAVTASNFASQTANNVLIAPNGTAGVPTFRALVAADIPTLNQNTTGTASNVTGTVAIANGGTGATTAATALTNLGAYPATNPNGYTSNTGTVTGVTGTAPIVSSGGTAPAISISAATTSAAGSMSAADKTKLDGIATGATANTGTVTSVATSGTVSGLTLTGGTITTSGTITLGGTLAVTPSNFASQTANTVLAAPNGSAGTPTFRALAAADIPELTLEKLPDAWVKRAVRVATTANITLSGTQTIDGIAVVAGDRVLVKDQTTASQNGIYIVSATAWSRSLDADAATDLGAAQVAVDSGTTNGGYTFDTDFKTTDTVGTTAMNWSRVLDVAYLSTVGNNFATLANPSAITFPRINANNTVSALDAATFRTAIGAGTSSTTGTVTSVAVSGGTTGLTTSGGPITSSGTITLAGTLAIANGGTGATTRQDAMDALAGSVTSGQYLRGNGTDVVMSAIQAADVPTLNQSTTGNAATATTATNVSGGTANVTTLTVNSNNISAVNSLGFRNRIINGDMRIDQRNNGASVTPASNGYTLDRWNAGMSQGSKFSVQRNAGSVTPPTGFQNYLGVTSFAATSLGASDFFFVQQIVEGFNAADLNWGTASAQPVTLSFLVRSSLTGTFAGSLRNEAANRSYPFSYTISAANTWQQKTVNIVGDTTGTWVFDNGAGIQVAFSLGMGSTFSGTAGSWSGSNLVSTTGAVSVVGTNGATFYITGVQLEAGSVATPFERRDYGRELMMCQRYYYQVAGENTYAATGAFRASPTVAEASFNHPVSMRASPTITASSSGAFNIYCTIGAPLSTSFSVVYASPRSAWISCSNGFTLTQGTGAMFYMASGQTMAVSAEI